MKVERILTTVDSHTAGEPTRVVTGGLPPVPGKTIGDKLRYFQANLDWVRTTLIQEPRGHRDMIGAVLLPPSQPDADTGVLFLNPRRYFNLCGHGSIGVATTLVALGLKPAVEPVTRVVLETPSGLVKVLVRVQDGEILDAGLVCVPSFLYAENVPLAPAGVPELRVDIAYGGNFYILVDVAALGLEILPKNVDAFFRVAGAIADGVNAAVRVVQPGHGEPARARSVLFHGAPHHPQANARTLLVGGGGTIDRSPCGTGTAARVAALHAKGELAVGGTYCTESVVGTLFHATVLEETRVAERVAVIPEIRGSAYITGLHQFVIQPHDPLKNGFLLDS